MDSFIKEIFFSIKDLKPALLSGVSKEIFSVSLFHKKSNIAIGLFIILINKSFLSLAIRLSGSCPSGRKINLRDVRGRGKIEGEEQELVTAMIVNVTRVSVRQLKVKNPKNDPNQGLPPKILEFRYISVIFPLKGSYEIYYFQGTKGFHR